MRNGRESESTGPAGAAAPSPFGIPEAELTPRVRETLTALTGEVERLRARLESAEAMADQDGLLPILNRRAFVRELSRAISFAERYSEPASLIYFDLDGFKAVNDAYGHAAGDAALQYAAAFLTANVRESDVIGRLGGDEFGVILAKADQDQSEHKARALADLFLSQPFAWQGLELALSFAYGAHMFRKGDTPEVAMAVADTAMYAAKRRKDVR